MGLRLPIFRFKVILHRIQGPNGGAAAPMDQDDSNAPLPDVQEAPGATMCCMQSTWGKCVESAQ